jgi:AraC-like DNA-binding protein
MAPSDDDHALFARIDTLMAARRLHGPAKTLTIAVNRVTRQNILRHVNGHRIDTGRASLQKGASETEAMLDAGFLTKSNFNREFRRITGKTPSDKCGARHAKG